MESIKYIGLDVHQSTISVAVLNADGKLTMQSVIATKASAVLDLLKGVRGVLHVTFEEGTHSAWLYDLLSRRVEKLVVCNPRRNALLKSGNKGDQSTHASWPSFCGRGCCRRSITVRPGARRFSNWRAVTRCSPKTPTRAMGRIEGCVSRPGDCLHGKEVYRARTVTNIWRGSAFAL